MELLTPSPTPNLEDQTTFRERFLCDHLVASYDMQAEQQFYSLRHRKLHGGPPLKAKLICKAFMSQTCGQWA